MGWTVRGSNPGGGEIFRTRQTTLAAHPTSNTMRTESFPGVKRPGRGVDNPPHLAPRFNKEDSNTCIPHLGLRGLFQSEVIFKMSVQAVSKTLGQIQERVFYTKTEKEVLICLAMCGFLV